MPSTLFLWGFLLCIFAWHGFDVSAFAPSTVNTQHRLVVSKPNIDDSVVPLQSTSALRVAISPESSTSYKATKRQETTPIPFVIEELRNQPNDKVLQEICQMCIAAFFNDGPKGKRTPFYKELQLGYLRSLQQSDLKRRRKLFPDTNMMFVARRVIPATMDTARRTPLILDTSKIYNLRGSEQADFCRGEILGFVEVTQRQYGLGGTEGIGLDGEGGLRSLRRRGMYTDRPVLTNLSVKYDARQSGVGGRLLEQCERLVQSRWNMQEIILEVEDDNSKALDFYTKRGYKVLFEDPASRRYDTNGLILRQLRCRRKVLRKLLSPLSSTMDNIPEMVNPSFVGVAWQRLKESMKL